MINKKKKIIKEEVIDMRNKCIGRICSLISKMFFFKKEVLIKLIHCDGIRFKKKFYFHHTGYPGGLIRKSNFDIVKKKGSIFYIKKVLYGMIKNKKFIEKEIKYKKW